MAHSIHSIIEALNWRYAVKKFDPAKPLTVEQKNAILESLRLSPSSYGLQPWKFVVVENKELLVKLREKAFGQSQVSDCSLFVVLTHLRDMTEGYIQKYLESISKTRGIPVETLAGFKTVIMGDLVTGPRHATIQSWAAKQSYIAMGQSLAVAGVIGIDACPLEGLNPGAFDEILGLNETPYMTVAAIAFGIRHSEDKMQMAKKSRFEFSEVIEIRK